MHANTHVRTRASKHARTGVTNAFFVLLITMAIFAVFGIEMFHTSDELDCAEQFLLGCHGGGGVCSFRHVDLGWDSCILVGLGQWWG